MRHLQQNAASTLRRVRRGKPVEITDRGRPVALLTPISHTDVREALEAAGRLTRAEQDLLDLPAPIRVGPNVEKPSRRLQTLRSTER